ncbi:MAG: tetratricopeptide repeat protein [Mycobacteriales bacterium]
MTLQPDRAVSSAEVGRRTSPAALDADAEQAWDRVRVQFLLQQGFWLGFLFGAQTVELTELAGRTHDLARAHVGYVEELRIASDADVDRALSGLLASARPGLLATWLVDDPVAESSLRQQWWLRLFHRLNERRDAVRAARPAALLLACPAGALGLVRDEAPDLWSYRSLAVTLEAPAPRRAEPTSAPAPDAEVAVPARPEAEPVRPSPAIAEQVRRAANALRGKRTGAALEAAQRAVESATTPDDRIVANSWLAQARMQQGDEDEARRLARLSLSPGRPMEVASHLAMLTILAGSPDPSEQSSVSQVLVRLHRDAVARTPDSPESLRDLSVALENVGRVRGRQGDLDGALGVFSESLALRRRVAESYGVTPQALRDLSVALDNVGRVRERQGDLDAALGAFSESLELSRRVAEQYGVTPQALRDLSVSLNNVGRVRERQGDLDAALGVFSESLALRRRLAESYGVTPESLRDLSVSLNLVGRVRERQGDLDGAGRDYAEAASWCMGLNERYPGALSDESQLQHLKASLQRVGADAPADPSGR